MVRAFPRDHVDPLHLRGVCLKSLRPTLLDSRSIDKRWLISDYPHQLRTIPISPAALMRESRFHIVFNKYLANESRQREVTFWKSTTIMRNEPFFHKLYWRVLRAIGFRQLSWNKQFDAGRWTRGDIAPETRTLVTELCNGGRLVEFGCSDGVLPVSIPRNQFSDYLGFDISDSAIQQAQERVREAGLTGVTFSVCDMAKWQGGISSVTLVVVDECLYYLSTAEVEIFLQHCCESLVPGGKILVLIHSGTKHQQTLTTCRRICDVCQETVTGKGRVCLTLAPKGQGKNGIPARRD